MGKVKRWLIFCFVTIAIIGALPLLHQIYWYATRSSADLAEVRQRIEPDLKSDLIAAGMELG